jgi:hypothetical protein
MSYQLVQLAPGAYDVVLNGEIIASVVRHASSTTTWTAELLDDLPPPERPAPFTQIEHQFCSLEAVRDWLGHPPVKAIRCAREL